MTVRFATTNLIQRGGNVRIVTLGWRRRRVAAFVIPIRVGRKFAKQFLSQQVQIFNRQLQNLPLHFVVIFTAVLGTIDVLGKVRVLQILLQVVDPIEDVTRLPQEIFERNPQIDPYVVIVVQETFKVRRELRWFHHFVQRLDRDGGGLELVLAAGDRRTLLLPEVVRLDYDRLVDDV